MYPSDAGAAPGAATWIEAALAQLRAGGERAALVDHVAEGAERGRGEAGARELLVESGALAVAFVRLGLRRGERLVLALPAGRRHAIALLAALRAGLIVVPLHPKCKARELAHVAWDSAPRAALAGDDFAARLAEAAPATRALRFEQLAAAADEARTELRDAELEADSALHFDHAGVTPDARDPALLLYTSGTTGRPKGALHTQGSLAACCAALAEAWQLGPHDVLHHCLPLHHLHGLVVGLMAGLASGARIELHDGFEERTTLELLAGRGATLFFGVPSIYARLVERLEAGERAPAGVRLFVSGSAPLPAALKRRFEAATGHAILERYGATEMGIALSQRLAGARPAGSVGHPLRGVETRLVRVEDGLDDPREGELLVRGPSLFAGYWEDPEASAAALRDGWYRTGDLARRADDGSYALLGRLSTDVIKVHGHKVGALEIESCLAEHPLVAEAAVIGRPDPAAGEVPVAYVRLRGAGARSPERDARASEALLVHASSALAPYQVPARIVFVDELPRTGPGKVDKRALRDPG